MTQVECAGCRKSFPMNETYAVHGRAFCQPCGDAELSQLASVNVRPGDVARQVDPTICAGCQLDTGRSALGTLPSGLPVCEPCREKVLNRPYPGWVKAAFAAVLVLAAVSFARNWRFAAGYWETKQSVRAAQTGDFRKASELMDRAARNVPEAAELGELASYYRALVFLSGDRSAEAVPLLEAYIARNPTSETAKGLLIQAQSGAAFDRKDYDAFLTAAHKYAGTDPGTANTALRLASAYACKYASTGDEKFKQEAAENLARARTRASLQKEDLGNLPERIEHRLATREILSPTEYQKRYPRGWKTAAGEER